MAEHIESGSKKRAAVGAAFLWVLTLGLFLLVASIPLPDHDVEVRVLTNSMDKPLRVLVFSAEEKPETPSPAVIICQPLNNPPEFARPLALELVKRGFVALTFDWRGHSPDENRQTLRKKLHETLQSDMEAVIAFLKGDARVDGERIGVVGHSVGANIALDAAINDSSIGATVCVGMATEVPEGKPRNLLWAAGLFDEFRTEDSMLQAYVESGGEAKLHVERTGDFADGTARGIAISPTADHFTEMFDSRLHREIVDWFSASFGLKASRHYFLVEMRYLVYTLAWLVFLVSAVFTSKFALDGNKLRLRAVSGALLCALAAVSLCKLEAPAFCFDLAGAAMTFVLLIGFVCTQTSEELRARCSWFVRVALMLWATVLLTLFINVLPSYAHSPVRLMYFLEFAIKHALDWVYAYGLLYSKQVLFSKHTSGVLIVGPVAYAVIIIELLSPGIILRSATRLLRRRKGTKKKTSKISLKHMALFGVLLVVFGGILWVRLGQGFVTKESALEAGRFILRFGLVPLGVFTILRRLFRRNTHAED